LFVLSLVGLLAACKVFDASLVPDEDDGSDTDDSVCTAGAEEVCNGRDDDCDDDVDEDTNLDADEENCGGCGRVCSFAHATGECSSGVCANGCEEGWKDCNDDDLDGCEADLASRATCGDCGLPCAFACSAGGCVTGATLAAGRTWTCASFSNGTARCWGHNGSGQLGTGDTVTSFLPRDVKELSDATRLTAGFGHSCALREGRVASCWGENDRGQLGDRTTAPRSVPVPVQLEDVDNIAVGLAHTCVQSGVRLYCWGFNDAGQLGFGDNTHRPEPEMIPAADTLDVSDVAAGLAHTCAVRTSGEVICFGFNDQGQSGMPNAGGGGANQVLSPVVVPAIDNATQVALGHAHSCAVTTAKTVRCWGWNGGGQLGDGGFASRPQPLFVIDGSGNQLGNIERVFAGAKRSCAIDSEGAAFCWGDNTSGALGAGPTPSQLAHAVRVMALGSDTILDVAVGEFHTCFLGMLGIRCVGDNDLGQLGDGSTAASTTGVDVSL
jgi:alpha-tubulin suppressor-like RCC1 family protein